MSSPPVCLDLGLPDPFVSPRRETSSLLSYCSDDCTGETPRPSSACAMDTSAPGGPSNDQNEEFVVSITQGELYFSDGSTAGYDSPGYSSLASSSQTVVAHRLPNGVPPHHFQFPDPETVNGYGTFYGSVTDLHRIEGWKPSFWDRFSPPQMIFVVALLSAVSASLFWLIVFQLSPHC